MGAPTTRVVALAVAALGVGALSLSGLFGGCAAAGGSSGDDDSSTTTTQSTTSTGVGASGGTGGQAAAGAAGTGGRGGTGGGAGGTGGDAGAGGDPGPCSYGSPTCYLQRWDFDTGCPSGWTTSGQNSDWACGHPTFPPNDDCEGSGNVWGTNLHNNAATCQNSYLVSPELDLSAYQGQTVLLGYYHWYDFRECVGALCIFPVNTWCYSGGIVQVNSGSGWTTVTPQGGYEAGGKRVECSSSDGGAPPCSGMSCDVDGMTSAYTCGGQESQWHQGLVDISSYLSSTFRVRFVYGSGEADPIMFITRAGWYVDNIAIFIPGSCP